MSNQYLTTEEIINSVSLKQRFAKNNNLPITVFQNPYFIQRLSLCEHLPQYRNCKEKFDLFCRELMTFHDEQHYFEYYNRIKDTAMSYIKENEVWQEFNNTNISVLFADEVQDSFNSRNLYIEDNHEHYFISIDMKQANFSALKHFNQNYAKSHKQLFDGYENWADFLAQITDCRHITESKYIRQVILGNCNPKKQTKYEKALMSILATKLKKATYQVFSVTTDEIIIEADGFDIKDAESLKEKVKNDYAADLMMEPEMLKVEFFKLEKIQNTSGWMKVNPNIQHIKNKIEGIEFKCIDGELFPQIVKYFIGNTILDEDLVFYHNGRLARFLEPIECPFG